MSEGLAWVLAGLAGAGLGAMFFGGLWWTVGRMLTSPRPALLAASSLLLRSSLALGGFYAVGHDRWQRLLVCLAGFVMARLLVTWVTPLARERRTPHPGKPSHAT